MLVDIVLVEVFLSCEMIGRAKSKAVNRKVVDSLGWRQLAGAVNLEEVNGFCVELALIKSVAVGFAVVGRYCRTWDEQLVSASRQY